MIFTLLFTIAAHASIEMPQGIKINECLSIRGLGYEVTQRLGAHEYAIYRFISHDTSILKTKKELERTGLYDFKIKLVGTTHATLKNGFKEEIYLWNTCD